jgi:hypothetical protein
LNFNSQIFHQKPFKINSSRLNTHLFNHKPGGTLKHLYDKITFTMSIIRAVWNTIRRYFHLGILIILLVFLLQRSDLEPGDPVEQVRAFTRQGEFDFITWTIEAFWVKGAQMGLGAMDYVPEPQQSKFVVTYLDLVRQIHQIEEGIDQIYADPNISDPETASHELRAQFDELIEKRGKYAPFAEAVIQNQLSKITSDLGLSFGGQPIPPILYHVSPLPRALVVSPRDIIRQDASISLLPDITIPEQNDLENEVDQKLDVSSLVVGIGGIGLYPTMVMETTNINLLAEVVSHEWVHNYLTLRPLGANYGTSPELRIINETVANLAEKEFGGVLIEQFYPEYKPQPQPPAAENKVNPDPPDPPAFDFRTEMNITRTHTDKLLAEGKIEEAEVFMEERRLFFWENGYRIRKINQAYFAFYGAYADQPGGAAGASEDPIGDAVRTLRAQSPSLAAFLNRISWMWSLEQLQQAIRAGERIK